MRFSRCIINVNGKYHENYCIFCGKTELQEFRYTAEMTIKEKF